MHLNNTKYEISIYLWPCFVEIVYLYPVDNKKKYFSKKNNFSRAMATSHIKLLECTEKKVVNTDQQRLYACNLKQKSETSRQQKKTLLFF